MSATSITKGLFVDLDRKLKKRARNVGERKVLAKAGKDRRNLQKLIKNGKTGKVGTDLGKFADMLQQLDIVLEFKGFVIGPAIRPK